MGRSAGVTRQESYYQGFRFLPYDTFKCVSWPPPEFLTKRGVDVERFMPRTTRAARLVRLALTMRLAVRRRRTTAVLRNARTRTEFGR